jgi:hypothetical protein
MTIKDKIKRRHLIWFFGATVFIILAKTCDTQPYDSGDIENDIKKLHNTKDSTLELADEFLNQYHLSNEQKLSEIDSLHHILDSNKQLTKNEIDRLKRMIETRREEIVAVPERVVRPVFEDSIVYNIIKKDTVIYDTIYKPFIVTDTVYEIDTMHYHSDEIKKIKLKKKED